MKFKLLKYDDKARTGIISFKRGLIRTPAFMPVGTYGTVKTLTPVDIKKTGADIILGNTFHLMLRPGVEIIREHGTLHDFMKWQGPILTDSGGIQEEAPSLGKPVLVMRNTTERPEGVDSNTLKLVGTEKNNIIKNVSELIELEDTYNEMSNSINPYGDGKASIRILEILNLFFK